MYRGIIKAILKLVKTEVGCQICLLAYKEMILPASQHAHVNSEGTKHRGGAHGRPQTARGSV